MNLFLLFRDRVRNVVLKHEILAERIGSGALAFVSLLILKEYFGYSTPINHMWLIVILAIFCAFLPMSGIAIVLDIYLLLNLTSLSIDVAIVVLLMIIAANLVCAFYGVNNYGDVTLIPVFQQWRVPFLPVMGSAMLGGINEIAATISGGIIAFFLKAVRENSSMFLDDTANISAMDLIINQMLGNHLFYFYIVALVVMFIVTYNIKCRDINHAWSLAAIFGVLSEFIIMLTGYLFTSNASRIGGLILGNIIVLLFGLGINYFVRDLDYSRVEKVQFEDDDYYYYVTAVPKIRIAEEHVQVKKITKE